MKRPVKLEFRSPKAVMDITGNIPGWCFDSIPYAQAERTVVPQGTFVSQYYSHFLFFLEVLDIDLQSDIIADYLIEKSSLFLFMVLEGEIEFKVPDKDMTMEVNGSTCYATYNHEGRFTFALPKGKHRLCYIVPRTEWIIKNIRSYPRLERFMETMMTSASPYGHLPSCEISRGMELGLKKLFGRYEKGGKDLEAVLLRDAKRILYHYQKLLDSKLAKRIHLIRDYMEKHLSDPDLNNSSLASAFHITEKTLIDTFKAEFGTTPYNYLIQLRMDRARQILELEHRSPSEVCFLVGYTNFRSFRAQFIKAHGIPPQQCLKPTK